MLTLETLEIGGRYNWKNQPERLVYIGMCEPRNGRWHQFAKVDKPGEVWCEVLGSDLHMLEKTTLDACEVCKGERGGIPGEENNIDGKVVCCHCANDWIRQLQGQN